MENTKKSLSDSILEFTKLTPDISESTSSTTASNSLATNSVTEAGSGFFGFISSFSWVTWIIIIFLLAFLGFNIFAYLAKGTQEVTDIFDPLLRMIFGTSAAVAGETIDVAAEGGKAVVSGTAKGVNTGLTAVQDITPNPSKSSVHSTKVDNDEYEESKNTLNKVLSKSSQNNKNKKSEEEDDYEPNEASSSVHTGKAGWCFIGEDRGYRSCSKVGVDDKCMSGDIFPSQDLCINPNLRS